MDTGYSADSPYSPHQQQSGVAPTADHPAPAPNQYMAVPPDIQAAMDAAMAHHRDTSAIDVPNHSHMGLNT